MSDNIVTLLTDLGDSAQFFDRRNRDARMEEFRARQRNLNTRASAIYNGRIPIFRAVVRSYVGLTASWQKLPQIAPSPAS